VSPRLGVPPLDPLPAIQHAAGIADEACKVANDASIGVRSVIFGYMSNSQLKMLAVKPSWYTKRATLAAIYAAAGKDGFSYRPSPPWTPFFFF
jgi:ubiquinone biosynthesis protein COQ9